MPSQDTPQYFFFETICPNEIFKPISGFQQSVTYIWFPIFGTRYDHIFIQMMDRKPQNLKNTN